MLRRGFDQPVVNLHELSNGLEKYYNEALGQECLRKPQGVDWGYFQTLPEIQELLTSTNHYKTSRLAHYHLVNRKDSISDQTKFYDYLNRNFYIISCRRQNLLEHALSWVIFSHSKHLNVYSAQEKIDLFESIYANGIEATQLGIENYLNKYQAYTEWTETYFNVQSYFDYDTDMNQIEDYILNLDFMRGAENNRWQDMFEQDFKTWNACHRLLPNLQLGASNPDATLQITVNQSVIKESKWAELRGPDWPGLFENYGSAQLPVAIDQEIKHKFNMQTVDVTPEQHKFLTQHLGNYNRVAGVIEQLKDRGLLVSGVPIKLQSLQEKKSIIRNFDQCVEWYNQWAEKSSIGATYSTDQLTNLAVSEENILNNPILQKLTNTAYKTISSE
jgi:hypothetical protein